MTIFYLYCTPEWLIECTDQYRANPRFARELAKLTTSVFFRIKAEPAWGIDEDILFGASVTRGSLDEMAFVGETEARARGDYILAATPQEWKLILRKENQFLTDLLLGRVRIEMGSRVGMLGLAPYANTFVDALTQVELRFPDEMTPAELEAFRARVIEFRTQLNV